MSVRFALGAAHPAFEARLRALETSRFADRLARLDSTLWSADPAHQRVAANRLGWLTVPGIIAGHLGELAAFASRMARAGFTHAVLLGMGGSSLAPEVLSLTFGTRAGSLELAVLDNTSPAAVRAVTQSHDLKHTLFVVSSKSGGTLEVTSFEKHFFEAVRAVRGADAGTSFVAITDAGTSLEALARARGYARVFVNPSDIGGRYSALSYFGLVPAALLGADLERLLAGARAEALAPAGDGGNASPAGVPLGAALGELALAGRDKMTLVLDHRIGALGAWIEQLVAESTGKDGHGLIPIADEPLGRPDVYGHDRVFVAVSVDAPDPATERLLGDLEAAGHPVLSWTRPEPTELGAEFLRWEIATATAGAVLGVDPFGEPNVAEAKQATQATLDRYLAEGALPGAPGRLLRHPRLPEPHPRDSRAAGAAAPRDPRPRAPGHHPRLRPALPALDRPAPQGWTQHRLVPGAHRRRGRGRAHPGRALRLRGAAPGPGHGRSRGARAPWPPGRASSPGRRHRACARAADHGDRFARTVIERTMSPCRIDSLSSR